jgi:hypothetical protein
MLSLVELAHSAACNSQLRREPKLQLTTASHSAACSLMSGALLHLKRKEEQEGYQGEHEDSHHRKSSQHHVQHQLPCLCLQPLVHYFHDSSDLLTQPLLQLTQRIV